MYRAGFVAERIGVSVATIRAWSTQFAEFLSEPARTSVNPDGSPTQRRYRDDDLTLLAWIKVLLGQGITFEEARRRLRDMSLEERATPPPSDVLTPSPVSPTETTALALPDMLRAITDAHRGEVEALRARIADLQADKTRLQSELDALRVQLAPPALPPPVQPPITPITEAPERPKPWWKLW